MWLLARSNKSQVISAQLSTKQKSYNQFDQAILVKKKIDLATFQHVYFYVNLQLLVDNSQ